MAWFAEILRCTALLLTTGAWLGGCEESRPPTSAEAAPLRWKTYEGAWFRIQYPAHFRVEPSLPTTGGEGYDSVFFRAPDGRASFYVLSPQWGRPPVDVVLREDRERELMVEEKMAGDTRVLVRTIVAKNGAYSRLLEEHEEQDGMVYSVMGFEYRNEEARYHYRDIYEHFKASLEQFADH